MGWKIEYDPEAIKDLNKLSRSLRAEIFDYMIARIASAENPRDFGKPLRYDKFELWRYRVRDYRIVCELKEQQRTVLVVGVGHRKNVTSDGRHCGCASDAARAAMASTPPT